MSALPLQTWPAGTEAVAKGIATSEVPAGWVHNLDPFLIQFTEQIGVRWYGLAYLSGFFVGFWLISLIARRGLVAVDGSRSLPEERIGDFVLAVVIGTMLGGRVGYALFYSQDLVTDFSTRFPFWGVLRVWEGGMASHGGMLGIIFAAVYFARKNGFDWMNLGDLTTLGRFTWNFLRANRKLYEWRTLWSPGHSRRQRPCLGSMGGQIPKRSLSLVEA
jgi:prolipoprotein diacylglyceryltransferase